MAGKTKRYYAGNQYMYDNTARKIQKDHLDTPERQIRRKAQIRRNQQKALQIDGLYLTVLVAAMICILSACVYYLQLQSSITGRMNQIRTKESELKTLRESNDMLLTHINTGLDLEYVYQVATQELGMVYAKKEQIILYDKKESEYVRQYEDIPQ